MDFNEVRDLLDQACDYPIEHEALVEAVGDVTIDAPADGSETVDAVLDRAGKTRYRSADDAYQTLLACVGETYVGRKHYDDRSGVRSLPDSRTDVSL